MSNIGTFHGAGMILWIIVWWLVGLLAIGLLRAFPHIPLRKPTHGVTTGQDGPPPSEHPQASGLNG